MRTSQHAGLRMRILDGLYTYCAFCIALSLIPALVLSYFVVRISKHLWLKLLSSRYPHVEFIKTDTVRALLDTHRNQGIINVLLCVEGTLNVEEIKQCLNQHVIERRDRNGGYMFPRLRHQLVSCWGNYAWDVKVPFRADNHVIVANAVHRGRPVSDNNLQDYVSEIVSKYFPSDQSPWQYIIIPHASPEPKYHILVRVHHLLLTGKQSLNIGDFLLVEQKKTSSSLSEQECPLLTVVPTPTSIPELWEKVNEMMSNTWNEFVSEYDPVESTRALKTRPGMFHVAGLVMLAIVSAFRDLSKQRYNKSASDPRVTAATLLLAVNRECKRRNLTILKVLLSPLVTIDPRKWPAVAIGGTFTVTRGLIRLPLTIRDEIIAIRELNRSGRVLYPNTLTWRYGGLVQLMAQAIIETWTGLKEAYRAPRNLWTDLMQSHEDQQKHVLQTVSLCGRKVAAWSKPVSRESMDRAARALGMSATDISLYATTESLKSYFEQTNNHKPEVVLTTARAASEDFLFTFSEGNGKRYQRSQTGGMVCVALPLGGSVRRVRGVCGAGRARGAGLATLCSAQARCGAVTRAVPSPVARLALNLLSRRYAVSYAEVDAPAGLPRRRTLWRHPLDTIVYWRPPQANISMSLTVIQYADTVRLSVMADARLKPGHAIPAARWPIVVDQLVNKIDQEIARITAQARPNIPRIIEPSYDEESHDEEVTQTEEPSTSTLKPPGTEVVSPPPVRKRILN